MDIPNLNIEQSLSFSQQQDELIHGHQLEMQQVLADKKHLRDIIAQQQSIIAEKDTIIASKDAVITQKDQHIAQLLQRINDLQNPTSVTNIAGNYYEQMQVNTMNISSSLPPASIHKYRKRKTKLTTTDILQLPLWQTS